MASPPDSMPAIRTATSGEWVHSPLNRRQFLRAGCAVASMVVLSPLLVRPAYAALAGKPTRSIALANLHTGEACTLTYWEQGTYIPEALATISRVLRDHRTNEMHAMDPALLDLLTALLGRLETKAPFEVISGYRSPQSNALMHGRSAGVASKSLHMQGKAIDVRVTNRSLTLVHNTALAMGLGGVGYYPTSGFVHVDTGRIRHWEGA